MRVLSAALFGMYVCGSVMAGPIEDVARSISDYGQYQPERNLAQEHAKQITAAMQDFLLATTYVPECGAKPKTATADRRHRLAQITEHGLAVVLLRQEQAALMQAAGTAEAHRAQLCDEVKRQGSWLACLQAGATANCPEPSIQDNSRALVEAVAELHITLAHLEPHLRGLWSDYASKFEETIRARIVHDPKRLEKVMGKYLEAAWAQYVDFSARAAQVHAISAIKPAMQTQLLRLIPGAPEPEVYSALQKRLVALGQQREIKEVVTVAQRRAALARASAALHRDMIEATNVLREGLAHILAEGNRRSHEILAASHALTHGLQTDVLGVSYSVKPHRAHDGRRLLQVDLFATSLLPCDGDCKRLPGIQSARSLDLGITLYDLTEAYSGRSGFSVFDVMKVFGKNQIRFDPDALRRALVALKLPAPLLARKPLLKVDHSSGSVAVEFPRPDLLGTGRPIRLVLIAEGKPNATIERDIDELWSAVQTEVQAQLLQKARKAMAYEIPGVGFSLEVAGLSEPIRSASGEAIEVDVHIKVHAANRDTVTGSLHLRVTRDGELAWETQLEPRVAEQISLGARMQLEKRLQANQLAQVLEAVTPELEADGLKLRVAFNTKVCKLEPVKIALVSENPAAKTELMLRSCLFDWSKENAKQQIAKALEPDIERLREYVQSLFGGQSMICGDFKRKGRQVSFDLVLPLDGERRQDACDQKLRLASIRAYLDDANMPRVDLTSARIMAGDEEFRVEEWIRQNLPTNFGKAVAVTDGRFEHDGISARLAVEKVPYLGRLDLGRVAIAASGNLRIFDAVKEAVKAQAVAEIKKLAARDLPGFGPVSDIQPGIDISDNVFKLSATVQVEVLGQKNGLRLELYPEFGVDGSTDALRAALMRHLKSYLTIPSPVAINSLKFEKLPSGHFGLSGAASINVVNTVSLVIPKFTCSLAGVITIDDYISASIGQSILLGNGLEVTKVGLRLGTRPASLAVMGTIAPQNTSAAAVGLDVLLETTSWTDYTLVGELVALSKPLARTTGRLSFHGDTPLEFKSEIIGPLAKVLQVGQGGRLSRDEATLNAEAGLFGARLSEARLTIPLQPGRKASAHALLNLEVLRADLSIEGRDALLTDPHARATADADVFGQRLSSVKLDADLRRTRASFSVFGLSAAVSASSLPGLTPDLFWEAMQRLLKLDLRFPVDISRLEVSLVDKRSGVHTPDSGDVAESEGNNEEGDSHNVDGVEEQKPRYAPAPELERLEKKHSTEKDRNEQYGGISYHYECSSDMKAVFRVFGKNEKNFLFPLPPDQSERARLCDGNKFRAEWVRVVSDLEYLGYECDGEHIVEKAYWRPDENPLDARGEHFCGSIREKIKKTPPPEPLSLVGRLRIPGLSSESSSSEHEAESIRETESETESIRTPWQQKGYILFNRKDMNFYAVVSCSKGDVTLDENQPVEDIKRYQDICNKVRLVPLGQGLAPEENQTRVNTGQFVVTPAEWHLLMHTLLPQRLLGQSETTAEQPTQFQITRRDGLQINVIEFVQAGDGSRTYLAEPSQRSADAQARGQRLWVRVKHTDGLYPWVRRRDALSTAIVETLFEYPFAKLLMPAKDNKALFIGLSLEQVRFIDISGVKRDFQLKSPTGPLIDTTHPLTKELLAFAREKLVHEGYADKRRRILLRYVSDSDQPLVWFQMIGNSRTDIRLSNAGNSKDFGGSSDKLLACLQRNSEGEPSFSKQNRRKSLTEYLGSLEKFRGSLTTYPAQIFMQKDCLQ